MRFNFSASLALPLVMIAGISQAAPSQPEPPTHLDTLKTRRIAKIPRGNLTAVNADETLLLGSWVDGEEIRVSERPQQFDSRGNTAG
jgi:hypothetical protein